MPDIARHLEKAEKYLQKGRQDDALREFFEVLREDPAHETAARAADLALTLGHRTEAATLLRQLLERQLASNAETAAATYRKLLKLAPIPPTQTEQVARLLQKTSGRESIELYLSAVNSYAESGRTAEALSAMDVVVTMAPTVEHFSRLAALAERNRDLKKAVAALLRAGALQASQDAGAATTFYERAWQLNPSEVKAALAYTRSLMTDSSTGNAPKALAVIKPFSTGPEATPETRALYGRALIASGEFVEVVPFLGDMLQDDPGQIDNLVALVGRLLDEEQTAPAVDLARQLEQHQQHAGRLSRYAGQMRGLAEKYASCAPFQEYLVELFNSSNREQDYCQTLLRLFDLYLSAGNYIRASECLDRAAEVDPYEAGHKRRLEMLRGKIDPKRVAMVSGRIASAVTAEERHAQPAVATEELQESTVLEDLILQAEIFLQYSLSSRAMERLERIRKLFPGEELKNDKLRTLYAEAGMTLPTGAATVAVVPRVPDENSVNDIARLTEIARSINRQTSPRSVLFTAVNEAGRHWNVGRCIAVLCTPGKPPSLALEYCAPGISPSNVNATVTLVSLLYPLVIRQGPLSLPGSGGIAGDEALRQSAASLGGIRSLLVMPLMQGEEHIGLLMLAECREERRWSANDTVVLKTVAD
jgi:tetratricopeptide (TPR) repeat protein